MLKINEIVSNHLHPSLNQSLYSMSISAGTEQDEILSSVVWRRISPFFCWLKWVLWLYPELSSTVGLSCDMAFSFLDSLGSYPPPCIPFKSSFSLHHVDIQTVSCIQDSRRTGESAWGDTWTLLCSSSFRQTAIQKYEITSWLQSLFTTFHSFYKQKRIFRSTEPFTLKKTTNMSYRQSGNFSCCFLARPFSILN